MQKFDFFIDSHCHMFTIADVPLYFTIGKLLREKDHIGTYMLLPILSFIRPLFHPNKALGYYEPYIRHFESEPEQVMARLAKEIRNTISDNIFSRLASGAERITLTPLIMDFDPGASVKKLDGQINRLEAAARSNHSTDLKVLPFLGFHLDRGHLAEFLDKYRVASVRERGGYEKTANGDIIGVKLYPPMGFHVYPQSNPRQRQAFMNAYRLMSERGLPVTVHCQRHTFRFTDDADKYTDPHNWEAVLKDLSQHGPSEMRLNFAHFGGEEDIRNTVRFVSPKRNESHGFDNTYGGLVTTTWSYSIIGMLKKYPNTYADLAAFDFSNEGAVAAFHWILHLDIAGELDHLGEHSLFDKILWGSDYPMLLNSKLKDYGEIFERFVCSFPLTLRKGGRFEYPPLDGFPTEAEFVRKLVCDNPRKFLFG